MNAEAYLKIALSTFAVLGTGALSLAQQNAQNSGGYSASSVRVVSGADGNGTISVITNGVQQDYIVTPDGAISIGPDGQPQPAVKGGAAPFVRKGAATIAPGQKAFVGPGGPGVFKGGAGGMIDMNQIRQQVINTLRDTLGCTDEEWAVLGPKIEKVQLLQNAAGERTKNPIMPQASGTDPTTPESVKVARARLADFDKAVNSPEATDPQVRQAMIALREARAKVRGELTQARKDLVDLVTPRQEAILYQFGILEQ